MNGRERGLTALEVTITATILAALVGVAISALSSGLGVQRTEVAMADLQRQAGATLDRVAREIALSGSTTCTPLPAAGSFTTTLTYQENRGYADGAAVWGPVTRVELRADPDDPDDGADNDGDGLVDEKILVRILNPGEANENETVLTRWVRELAEGETANGADDNDNGLVDEAGFSLSLENGVWTVLLTLERPGGDGTIVTRTVETSVIPRN